MTRYQQMACGLVMIAAAACGGDGTSTSTTGGGGQSGCVALADGKCVEETFHNPPVLAPNGDGVYELELKPTEISVNGQRHCGRGFNGMYPAPTIETAAQSGGAARQIRVNLRNGFTKSDYRGVPAEPCMCMDKVSNTSCTPNHDHPNDTCECMAEDGSMCHVFDFNVTNLHAHGSHVRPNYAAGGGCVEKDGLRCRACNDDPTNGPKECFYSDDVLARVHAGEGTQVRWDIDEDGVHHPGLDWYHPHIHGSTAIQVASGAAGAWIVRGDVDEVPGIKDARERVMVFSTPPIVYTPLADGEPCDEDHLTFNGFYELQSISGTETNLINGIRRPRMLMPPGQIERWRFVHTAFLDEVWLVLFRGKDSDCSAVDLSKPPIKLTQIGRDGLTLSKPPSGEDWPYAPELLFLSTGYRVDALLDGGELKHGDTLCLKAAHVLQEDTTTHEPVDNGKIPTPEQILQDASKGDLVAIVNVTDHAGAPSETKMPDLSAVAKLAPSMMLQGGTVDALARCAEVESLQKPEEIDQLSELFMLFLNTGPDACACPDHNINCKNLEYTPRDKYPYDRVLVKGAIDHWRLLAGFDGHPFHIHINPFLVCPLAKSESANHTVRGRLFEPPFAHWRDTYLVNLDRRHDILTEYRAFTGSFVTHCHKLTHEDEGMMELLHICDPAVEPCDQLCSGGKCDWRTCAPGDESCQRALAATLCFFDPSTCADAALRCQTCDASKPCPPGAHCRTDADIDDQLRCAPGCLANGDCALTDACTAGACTPAPCSPPCAPGQMCAHGTCG